MVSHTCIVLVLTSAMSIYLCVYAHIVQVSDLLSHIMLLYHAVPSYCI